MTEFAGKDPFGQNRIFCELKDNIGSISVLVNRFIQYKQRDNNIKLLNTSIKIFRVYRNICMIYFVFIGVL